MIFLQFFYGLMLFDVPLQLSEELSEFRRILLESMNSVGGIVSSVQNIVQRVDKQSNVISVSFQSVQPVFSFLIMNFIVVFLFFLVWRGRISNSFE